MKTNVYNMSGAQVGEVELSDVIFGIEPNVSVMHDVVKNHLANCRQGTQSALTRAEVSGGGKKPWRQKGTGRARQGSTRAPQWTHGGIVFAPKPRDYSYRLNKKVRRLAIKSALSSKAQTNDIVVIDEIKMDEIKTKVFKQFLDAVKVDRKALVITAEANELVVKSARNIEGVEITFANLINVYDVLNANKLVMDKAALAKIVRVLRSAHRHQDRDQGCHRRDLRRQGRQGQHHPHGRQGQAAGPLSRRPHRLLQEGDDQADRRFQVHRVLRRHGLIQISKRSVTQNGTENFQALYPCKTEHDRFRFRGRR